MTIDQIFLRLMQATNSVTRNPLLHYFDLDDLKLIEEKSSEDKFIDEKRRKIKALVEDLAIDFNPKLKSAFDEYIEAMVYLKLKEKFISVNRIPEGPDKSPDFKIEFELRERDLAENCIVYAELKSLSYASNNVNYLDTMQQGLDAAISLEKQINEGKKVAFAITETAPLSNTNRQYDGTSTLYVIETYIEKICQNIKRGQFIFGDTILIVNLKQLLYQGDWTEASLPIYQEQRMKSFVSGTLWNVIFGKAGHLIFRPIEFEGKENVDGELTKNGILVDHDFVKAVVFLNYGLGAREPKIVGFHRSQEASSSILNFLYKFCEFVNDDANTNGWRITQSELTPHS